MWGEVKELTASDGVEDDEFGGCGGFNLSVAIDGDTLAVGACEHASFAGAVYIFERNEPVADNWGEVKKLTPSDPAAQFFHTVAISGDTIVAGAPAPAPGAAYIFERDQGGSDNWGEVKKIVAGDLVGSAQFGTSVGISGSNAVVSAHGIGNGAAYVFQRDLGGANNWGEAAKLVGSDAVGELGFALSVGISGGVQVAGHPLALPGGTGAAYVFEPALAPPPDSDVEITSVSSNLPLPNPNLPVQIFATVVNNGPMDLPAVEVLLFLDLDSSLTMDGGEPSFLTTLIDLVAGMSQNAVGSFVNPPAGSYLGVAVADPNDLLAEPDENNNAGSTAVDVTLPDLTVSDLMYVSVAKRGRFDVSLDATIDNIGANSASNVRVRFAFSTDSGANFTNITGPVNAGTIGPMSSTTATKSWKRVSPGSYTIRVTVDPDDLIGESDEANNVSTFMVDVFP